MLEHGHHTVQGWNSAGAESHILSVPGPLHPNHPSVSMSLFRSWGTGCFDVRQPKNISEDFFYPEFLSP